MGTIFGSHKHTEKQRKVKWARFLTASQVCHHILFNFCWSTLTYSWFGCRCACMMGSVYCAHRARSYVSLCSYRWLHAIRMNITLATYLQGVSHESVFLCVMFRQWISLDSIYEPWLLLNVNPTSKMLDVHDSRESNVIAPRNAIRYTNETFIDLKRT